MILTGRKPLRLLQLTMLLITSKALLSCAQATDGDEQFQVYHQDIGRISGSPSQVQVAPQTIVRQVSATQAAPVERPAIASQPPPPRPRSPQHPSRRPSASRITLAVRTSAPALPVAAPAEPAPEPAPELLLAPQRQQQALRQPQLLQAQAQPQPVAPSAEPMFAAQPALNSFRSTLTAAPGATGSVSARHSALMAQVAAERQAAEAISGQQQPSLGSPLEALSSPAGLQVQAPPTLQQPQLQPLQPQPQHLAAASAQPAFVNQPEEPLVAPTFEHVLARGCPPKGVFSYENKDHCDRYYMCTNGTFTEEACPNGLAYGQMGAVYQHCAYNWNVDCGNKKTAEPLASPGCPWQFGIFPVSGASGQRCSIDYFVCEWGVPETKRCHPEGLFYDDRIKGCQWADQLGCKSEALLNFKCPQEDEDNPYWPYPRYYHTKQDVIVCVNEQPRLVHCTEEQFVDPSSLACLDVKKSKKKKPANF